MSLLKGLRQLETAYQTKDWDLVFSAYEEIAGEPLEIQQSDDKNVVDRRYETADFIEPITFTPKKRGRPKKEKGGVVPVPEQDIVTTILSLGTSTSIVEAKKKTGTEVKWSGNSFVDDGREFAEDKDFDKKVSKNWKKPPPRPKHEYITVFCKTCSQNFQMDPSVVTENNMCNRCLAKKGRG